MPLADWRIDVAGNVSADLTEMCGTREETASALHAYAAYCGLLQSAPGITLPMLGTVHRATAWLTPHGRIVPIGSPRAATLAHPVHLMVSATEPARPAAGPTGGGESA
jgi:hypothetical protein